MRAVNWVFNEFGFMSAGDFIMSTFGVMLNKNSIIISMVLGFSLNNLTGLEPTLLLTIGVLFVLEIITGLIASIFFKDEKFDKEKLSRSIVKLFAYPVLLVIIQQFKNAEVGSIGIMDINVNFFDLSHTALIFLVVLQVLISLLDNLSSMGFKELDLITKIFKMKLSKVSNSQGIKNKENE